MEVHHYMVYKGETTKPAVFGAGFRGKYYEDRIGQDGWKCSKCKFFVPWYYSYYKNADFISKYHFCPKCGAEMKSYTGMENATPVITLNPRL